MNLLKTITICYKSSIFRSPKMSVFDFHLLNRIARFLSVISNPYHSSFPWLAGVNNNPFSEDSFLVTFDSQKPQKGVYYNLHFTIVATQIPRAA